MRSHECGNVESTLIDQSVTVCGWAHRRRDHGGVIFIDLRDRTGLVQVVADPDEKEAFDAADAVAQLGNAVEQHQDAQRQPQDQFADIIHVRSPGWC